MSKIEIRIEGYGMIKVKRPKTLNKKTYSDGIAEAVAKTCQLLVPVEKTKRFHPAMGFEECQ